MKPWSEYSEKERKILLLSGVILFVLLYFTVFFIPTIANINKLHKRIDIKEQEYQQLLSLVPEHRKFQNVTPETIDQPILSYLDQKIKSLNLSEKLAYIKPLEEDSKQIEIKLEKVNAREIVGLLYALERLPLAINQLNLRDYEQSGLWAMKIIVSGR